MFTPTPSANEESDSCTPGLYDNDNCESNMLPPSPPSHLASNHLKINSQGTSSSENSSHVENQAVNIQPPANLGVHADNHVDSYTGLQEDLHVAVMDVQQSQPAFVQVLLREIAKGNEKSNAVIAKLLAIEEKLDAIPTGRPVQITTEKNWVSPIIATTIKTLEELKKYEEFVAENEDNYYELVRFSFKL